MTSSPVESPGPVTADDVRATVDAAIATLRHAEGKYWQTTAGGLTWSCWETVEHMADDLFAYAGQLAPATPALTAYVPFGWKRRPDGPALTVYADADQGVPGLLQVLDASGGLLAALVRVAPPEQRGFHPLGLAELPGHAPLTKWRWYADVRG
ncbi:hypothetical protein [Actinoplanes sp. NPDC051851]|uniref:hypothetical protein n=1 Tax=Actinoplanes sp. NPDC051851 TaxID=3154753 RepID=UPI003443AC22